MVSLTLVGRVMTVPGGPAAFMSYVRFNDQHDDGQLSQFRERLEAEVRAQTGEEFTVFQDRNDIAWGQNWQQRIDEALNTVTLLLVMITPSLFRSPACRAEVAKFQERERTLGRADLILPVYYIDAREIDDPNLQQADDMAKMLASRQFADWRELRFEPFTSPLVRKAIAQLASRMRDTFWQPSTTLNQRQAAHDSAMESLAESSKQAGAISQITSKNEPPTHIVSALPGQGNFAAVSAAIETAKPGDRILVRPGLYAEGLVVDKPLEILGDGPAADIVIRASDVPVLTFRTSIGRVANMTLHQAEGKEEEHCVNITQGRLELEGCDISSQSTSCITITDGSDPRLRRNKIHDGKYFGVAVMKDGLGIVEDNDITGNAYSGVAISEGGNPTLRRNQIHHNGENGVYSYGTGQGTVENCDITDNGYSGVVMAEGGNLAVRNNRINRNKYSAIRVNTNGHGVVEDNNLTGNVRGAWDITDDCEANVIRTRNKVPRNKA